MKFSVTKTFKIWIAIAAAIIVAGAVLVGFLGFNETVNTGSSYEIIVSCEENLNDSETICRNAADKYFSSKGLAPVSYAVSTTGDGKVIYKFSEKSSVNQTEMQTVVQNALTEKGIGLEVKVKLYSAQTSSDQSALWISISGVVAFLVVFIYALFAEKASGAVTTLCVGLLSTLLFVGALAVTRLPLLTFGTAVAAGVAVLSSVIAVVMVNRFNNRKRMDSATKLSNAIVADECTKDSLLRIAFVFGSLLVGAIVIIAIGTDYLRFLGIELLIADVIACGTPLAFVPTLWSKLKKEKKKPAEVAVKAEE